LWISCIFALSPSNYLLTVGGYYISGIYGDSITLEKLKDFHRRRLQVLAESGADLIAFETIPNKIEAQVLMMIFDIL